MKNPWIVIGAIVIVLIGGSVAYSQYAAERSNEGVEGVETQVKGNPDAAVTLTKYSDFSCPACAQAYPFSKELVDMYGDDLRFEYKHFAFLEQGEPAALAAEAAGQQGEFFAYHDMLFENQRQWGQSGAPQQFFRQYAEELGLDMDEWNRHRSSPLLRSHVRAELQEGRALGVTGTPTFFLNGERMNFASFDEFRAQVEGALGVENTEADITHEGETMEVELEALEESGSGDTEVEFGF